MATLWRLIAAALLLAAPALADRTEKYPEQGFSIDRPTRFEARPAPPDVGGLLLVFAPRDAPTDQRAPVTHMVFRVPGATSEADVRRWIQARLQPVELAPERSVRKRYGRRPARFVGEIDDPDVGERVLFVHAWMGDDDAVVFVGECAPDIERRELRGFDRVADSFRFFDSEEESERREEWKRHYRRSSLPFVDERIEVAAALVPGWEVRDTKHSMVLYHGSATSPVLGQITAHLEAIRARFAEDLPPDRPIDQLSVVRVCRDRGEYLTYGGNPSTVGFFNPETQELVFYDARTEREGELPAGHPVLQVLYHEACHQFLHHTASALSPHSWYDEGTAEYYAGAQLVRGRVQSIERLPQREAYLRRPEVAARMPSLARLLRMTQRQFYADADVNYSMGYAFVRFLIASPAAQGHPRWRGVHARYFEALRAAWRREAEALALSGINAERYAAAIERAREAALEVAFEGVEIDRLEAAFLAWLAGR